MPGGRPLKFENEQVLKERINEYFESTPEGLRTITGLAVHLDTSRETLCNYEKKQEFFDTIKNAKDRVEMDYEISLRKRGSAGDIFGLKNFGWRDKTEQDITSGGEKIVLPMPPELIQKNDSLISSNSKPGSE